MAKNKFTLVASEQDIKLDIAKRVVSKNGCILNKAILSKLNVGNIVRISLHVSKKSRFEFKVERDAPYVSIEDIKEKYILGKILDTYRSMPGNYYSLQTGEHVWFKTQNIIEVTDCTDLYKFQTNQYVQYTGPLETVDYDSESSDESSGDSENSNEDEPIDMEKFDKRILPNRGRST